MSESEKCPHCGSVIRDNRHFDCGTHRDNEEWRTITCFARENATLRAELAQAREALAALWKSINRFAAKKAGRADTIRRLVKDLRISESVVQRMTQAYEEAYTGWFTRNLEIERLRAQRDAATKRSELLDAERSEYRKTLNAALARIFDLETKR